MILHRPNLADWPETMAWALAGATPLDHGFPSGPSDRRHRYAGEFGGWYGGGYRHQRWVKPAPVKKVIRIATAADLEAMTWVLIGAAPLDPIYPYRYPNRDLYTDELFARMCSQKCAEYLGTSTVVVCEMDRRVVAFAVWDPPSSIRDRYRSAPLQEPQPSAPSIPITIGHERRMRAFRETCAARKRALFDAVYTARGRQHMFLKILLCHPDYQRRGAGTALTSWGIDEARRAGVDTTVFASPMGLELYKKLGFKEVGRFRVQLEGEDVFLEIPALVLSGEKRVTEG
ncbi:acyl-CoA N-acyltransferase [Lasiosphaeris hirsuta]|uniref:Acyl-CoA N-acyltransferase n=1 Tax=Lasiosphaeris hirsuta TaxID=260670 RepID=A0AA39ZXV5_9PEZI|nr:acyl-CoA N-acyltransferase [Lasiosphaeris hirsuta]